MIDTPAESNARPIRRRAALVALTLALSAGTIGLATPAVAAPPDKVDVIVQLRPGADPDAESRRAAAAGGDVRHVYRSVLRGFAGSFTEQAMNGLRRNPQVESIEADGVATASAEQIPAPWGLDRIDDAQLPMDGGFTYPDAAGTGVTSYIVDTGIATHPEFGTRVQTGFTAINDGNLTTDCNGHGTHVAGTVGAATYGVAKATTLVPVRVLDCAGSGAWSGVIAGLDYVRSTRGSGVAVANMSLGGPANSAVDTAVRNLVSSGVTVVVAAGNSNRDACKSSPSRVTTAVTVGASDRTDNRASFSNYGTCLDLFAPGVGIESTWLGGGTNTISGTSMASPHVAGAAAVLLSTSTSLTPALVASTLTDRSTKNLIKSPGRGSPNRLLFVAPA